MNTKELAEQALRISQLGQLPLANGAISDFSAQQRHAEQSTQLYRPEQLAELIQNNQFVENKHSVKISVTHESTQQAAYRLIVEEQRNHVVLLNFASAKNAGGGFLGGAKAQEEDLCRSSGLYLCQLTQPDYYASNRHEKSMLYTDHIIYSPDVPFFRVSGNELLNQCFLASVITAPAPNAGEFLQREPNQINRLAETLQRRAEYVLAVAKAQQHKHLILGAWGCGVFRNSPKQVAKVFAECLAKPEFAYYFEDVVFAIYDRSTSQNVLSAFQRQFYNTNFHVYAQRTARPANKFTK